MIKINISNSNRKKIEKLIWRDAGYEKTGIISNLKEHPIDKRKYPQLYNLLYGAGGKVKKLEVKKLLLGDKKYLEEIIEKVGKIENEKADELLNLVFRYDAFSKRSVVKQILKILKVDVCPYCNRQYTTTLDKGNVRAQLDHYFPKSKYPYLALSIYNLIPCCPNCNVAKSDKDTYEKPILYPYEDEFGNDVNFKIDFKHDNYVRIMRGMSNEFDICIKTEKNAIKEIVDQEKEIFHLSDLYNTHKDYVKDLLKNRYINEGRIPELKKMFPKLFADDEDVKSSLFMSDIHKENWGNRPLAKLTHDIDKFML